jgi:hypothetical protein
MKTLMAAVAFVTVLAAPAFAQSGNAWGWIRCARRSGQRQVRVRCCVIRRPPRRAVGSPRRAAVRAFEHVLDALQLQCLPGEPVVPDQLQLNFGRRPSEGS